MRRILTACLLFVSLSLAGTDASASSIAIFGSNDTSGFLSANGHTVTLVTDAQLATPGFLNSFDVFYYTRDGDTFGAGLSAAAAAQVAAWVTGNAVALAADFADSLIGVDDPTIAQLTLNAVAYAAAFGNGFVGEFNGAAAALGANANGFNPLGIFAGNAGALGLNGGGSNLSLVADPLNGGHSVLAGIGLPYDPSDVEFGFLITGANPSQVIARWGSPTGNPAILARAATVPEPTTLLLLGGGLAGLYRARRKSAK